MLHYVAGAFVALGSGYLGFHRFMAALVRNMDKPGAAMIITGVLLTGGGLGGLLQDKLWSRGSDSLIPATEPEHSTISRFLVISSVIAGLFLASAGLLRYA